MIHKIPKCFQCHYEKNCSGVNFTKQCETLDLNEYKKQVCRQKSILQTNINSAIDEIRQVESKIEKIIEADPRIDIETRIDLDAIKSVLPASVDVDPDLLMQISAERQRKYHPTQTFGRNNPPTLPLNYNRAISTNDDVSTISATSSDLAKLKFTNLDEDSDSDSSTLSSDRLESDSDEDSDSQLSTLESDNKQLLREKTVSKSTISSEDSPDQYFPQAILNDAIGPLDEEETFSDDKVKNLVQMLTSFQVDEKVFKSVFKKSITDEAQLTRFVVDSDTIAIFLSSIQVKYIFLSIKQRQQLRDPTNHPNLKQHMRSMILQNILLRLPKRFLRLVLSLIWLE